MTSFTLKGSHVLAMLVAFFFCVIAINVGFTMVAVSTFPGQETEKPYFQGLHYNKALEARAQQHALGWTASIVEARRVGGNLRLKLALRDASGAPILGARIAGELRRPVADIEDRPSTWKTAGAGVYSGEASDVGPGQWLLSLNAVGVDGENFAMTGRLVLE